MLCRPRPVTKTPTADTSPNIAGLFVTPPQTVLQQPLPAPQCQERLIPPAPRQRKKRTFDMSTVRCSARLANALPMTAVRRAQRNLCRKLGLLNDELEPVERALQEYLAMFSGPLPADIIAALTALFNLNDDEAEEMDIDLADMVGEGIDDLEDAAQVLAD